jgi:salicylate hydroxylase
VTPIPYVTMDPPDSWIHENGKVVIIGDAAYTQPVSALIARAEYKHSGMLSKTSTMYAASVPVSDGETFGILFSRISSRAQIPALLGAYEEIRQPRVVMLATAGERMLDAYALPPGPAQEARDATFRDVMAYAHEFLEQETMDDSRAAVLRGLWSDYFDVCAHDPYDAAQEWWMKWGGSFDEGCSPKLLAVPIQGQDTHSE